MADKNAKHAQNVSGSFYVDTSCISCGLCVDMAPEFFQISDTAYVVAQPQTDVEKAKCQETLDSCPVNAIGNDG